MKPARATRRKERPKLIEYLKANPGSTAGEVAKALGLKPTSVASMMSSGSDFAKNPKCKGYVVAAPKRAPRNVRDPSVGDPVSSFSPGQNYTTSSRSPG